MDYNISLGPFLSYFNSTYYPEVLNATDGFISGLQCDSLLSTNCTPCAHHMLYFLYFSVQALPVKYYYGTFNDIVFNTSALLTNLSYTLNECTYLAENSQNFVVDFFGEFNNSVNNFTTSLF